MSRLDAKTLAYAMVIGLTLSALMVGNGSASPSHPHAWPTASATNSTWGSLAPGWSMFHGNNTVNGSYTGSFPWSHFDTKWTVSDSAWGFDPANSNAAPVQSSPVVYGGYVYIPESVTGNIVKVNASTGALAGYYDLTPLLTTLTNTVQSTPLITLFNGYPFLVYGTDHSNQYLISLNLTSGTASYCKAGQNIIGSAVAVSPQSFLVGADSAAGLWNLPTSPLSSGSNCPAFWQNTPGGSRFQSTGSVGFVSGATNYFLSDTANTKVDAYDAATKANLWNDPLFNNVYGSLALTNVTYNTTGGANHAVAPMGFIADDKNAAGTSHLYAIDVNCNTGASACFGGTNPGNNNLGEFAFSNGTTNNGVNGTVALQTLSPYQTRVVYATANGNLSGVTAALLSNTSVVNPTDRIGYSINWSDSWNLSTGSGFAASPVVAGGLAMDGGLNGKFYIVDANNGNIVYDHKYNGSFFASPAISGMDIYVLTSTGELADIAPASPPVHVAVKPTLSGGQPSSVNVTVTATSVTGSPGGPLANATVSLCFRGGSNLSCTSLPTNTTNSSGVAGFTWTPPLVNANLTYELVAKAMAPGYLNGTGRNVTNVNATVVTFKPLTLVVSPVLSALGPNQRTQVNFTLLSNGSAVPGAVISTLVPATGAWLDSPQATNSGGLAYANYSAPATIPGPESVLLGGDVSLVGYSNATGYGSVALTPPPSKPLTLVVSPELTALASNQRTQVNFTLLSNGSAVSGAIISTLVPATGAWLDSPQATNSRGLAYANYSAPATIPGPGSVLLGGNVSRVGYSNTTAYGSVALIPPSSNGTLTPLLSLSVNPTSVGVAEGATSGAITVTVSNMTSHNPVANATVTAPTWTGGFGTFNKASETTNASGDATFTFTGGSSPGTELGTFHATASHYLGANASFALSVVPPGSYRPLLELKVSSQPTAMPGSSIRFALTAYEVNSSTGANLGPAANAMVQGSIVTGLGTPTTLSAQLNSSGENDSLRLTTGLSSTAYLLQVSFTASLNGQTGGNVSSTAVIPPPLRVSATVSSPTVSPAGTGTLTVTVTSAGTAISGATVSVSSSGVTLANLTGLTDSTGRVTFPFTAGKQGGVSVSFYVTAAKTGFVSAYNTSALYISPTQTPGANNTPVAQGFSGLDWGLIALVVLLLLALVVALARRRPAQPAQGDGKDRPEKAAAETSPTGDSLASSHSTMPDAGIAAVGAATPTPPETGAAGGPAESTPEWSEGGDETSPGPEADPGAAGSGNETPPRTEP